MAEDKHPTGLVDISNDDYHAGPGISKSHLDAIAEKSPLHYWHKYINPERERAEPTTAMKLGTAIHSAILEPDLFATNFVQAPAFNRRTKEGRALAEEFEAKNEGKTVLTPEDHQTCLTIRDRVYAHPLAAGLLKDGKAEQSYYANDPETGELIKCRFDYLLDSGEMAIDVKSAIDASPAGFGRAVGNLRYDVAPAWYFDVLDVLYGEVPDHWVWLVVEKEPPYAIGIYYVLPEMVQRAREAARRDFMRIVECKQKDHWPDYALNIQAVELPGWVKR